MSPSYDAVVVGAGPNGLAAAITLAQAGLRTLLVERADAVGGGTRSSALTLPGFVHDECSAVHPLGRASPFFASLGLERYGLTWVDSPSPLAHVLDEERTVLLERSVEETAAQFGPDDEAAYRALVAPFARDFDPLVRMALAPLRLPARPLLMARFGLCAVRSMRGLARARFRTEAPRALLAGISAHSMIPLDRVVTASFALVLASAGHAVGWPVARGGSQAIADALLAHFVALGGEVRTGWPGARLSELPPARAYLFDVTPRGLLSIAGGALPAGYRRRLERFRHGPGVFKVDWALRGPIPWRDPRCARAVTVHLAGGLDEIAAGERAVNEGRTVERPFVLLGQPGVVDDSRAPPGAHTAWAYCHVPHGSDADALSAIEAQIERYAPGFRKLVLARATRDAVAMERHNPNYVGGDINSGVSDWSQLFFRPVLRADPYSTPAPHVFLCSASTPPGGGVHGMCGYWAARSALAKRFGVHIPGAMALRPGYALPPPAPRAGV